MSSFARGAIFRAPDANPWNHTVPDSIDPPPAPVPCPACGSRRSLRIWTTGDAQLGLPGPFHVSRCAECGLLFQNPRVPAERLGEHYPDDYGPYSPAEMRADRSTLWVLRHRRGYSHLDAPDGRDFPFRWTAPWGEYRAAAQLFPDHVPGGRLLEIACASGARLSFLQRLGWSDCSGVELSPAAAARARSRGFPVITGTVEEALETIPDASLDAVVAGFVMEHLENPFHVARRIARTLRPGGQFLFTTLAVGAPDFRIYGKYWYNLDLPRHMVFFRMRDIRRMLAEDFIVESVTHLSAPQEYTGSARYRSREESRLLDRLLLKAGGRIRPLCLLLAWLGWSSRVAVRCRRRGPS